MFTTHVWPDFDFISWSTDFNLPQVFVIRSVSLFSYNIDLPYLVHTDHGGYMSARHVSTDFDLHFHCVLN
jgi:hypothetical protein